jgi:hypothetical protein
MGGQFNSLQRWRGGRAIAHARCLSASIEYMPLPGAHNGGVVTTILSSRPVSFTQNLDCSLTRQGARFPYALHKGMFPARASGGESALAVRLRGTGQRSCTP